MRSKKLPNDRRVIATCVECQDEGLVHIEKNKFDNDHNYICNDCLEWYLNTHFDDEDVEDYRTWRWSPS